MTSQHDASSASAHAPGLVVQPSGTVDRPPTPERDWDPADTLPDADTYVAVPSSKAVRKRLREEKEILEAAGKRPRLLKRYVLVGLPPLQAPFHNELSPAEQVIDYRMYRQPNVPAVERLVLTRIVTHCPLRRSVLPKDEGYGYMFPEPQQALGRYNLPLDVFRQSEKPDDPSLQNRVVGWTQTEDYIVLSPNASYIPYVPPPHITNYRLRMRTDGRFGAEDWTLVPTYYMPRAAPHIACIPRCPITPGHPWHLMFLGVDVWFESVLDVYKPNVDKVVLSRAVYKELKKLVNPLRKLATEYLLSCKAKRTEPMPWARGLEMTIGHLMGRLAFVPVGKRRAVLMARECQRLWRELFGMMNFVHLVQPVLLGLVDAAEIKVPHWFVGAVTDDIEHVQLLYHAGVPVWYVMEFDFSLRQQLATVEKLGVPYAEEAQRMYAPAEMVCINRHPDNLPFIFEGSPKDPKHITALHRYATLQVAASRPGEDPAGDKDPLAFVAFEGGSSRHRPLQNMPTFIEEVGREGPPPVQGDPKFNIRPVAHRSLALRDELEPPSETLPASFYGEGEDEEFVPIDSPAWPSAELPSEAPTASQYGNGDTFNVEAVGVKFSDSDVFDVKFGNVRSLNGKTDHVDGDPVSTVRVFASEAGRPACCCAFEMGKGCVSSPHANCASPAAAPSALSSWEEQIKRIHPGLPFDSKKGDDYRSFPLASLITGPTTDERCAFYLQAWVTLAPYLVENAQDAVRDQDTFKVFGAGQKDVPEGSQQSVAHDKLKAIALKASDWKSLLFARVTMRNPQGRVAVCMNDIRCLVGEDFNWDLFVANQDLPYTVRGVVVQPGRLPPPHVMKDELLYVHELGFRQEMTDIDRTVRGIFVTPAEEVFRLGGVFDDRTWDGVDIFNLRDLGEGRGLAALDWVERVPYVQAFARLMLDWVPRLPPSLERRLDLKRMGYTEFYWFEGQVAAFYARVVWHSLHRVAIGPPRRSTLQ
ncbi:hypothetical protein GGF50DRAFT_92667 [Schizophyllum commune]